eukprot:GHVU01196422.1.p1 GENE.GHVU01196422.1~~GHVU01196422.1.p1  ORF type:complete len:137 (-),score=7.46 GHVU01196422.1:1102-1512(-)
MTMAIVCIGALFCLSVLTVFTRLNDCAICLTLVWGGIGTIVRLQDPGQNLLSLFDAKFIASVRDAVAVLVATNGALALYCIVTCSVAYFTGKSLEQHVVAMPFFPKIRANPPHEGADEFDSNLTCGMTGEHRSPYV